MNNSTTLSFGGKNRNTAGTEKRNVVYIFTFTTWNLKRHEPIKLQRGTLVVEEELEMINTLPSALLRETKERWFAA